MAPVIFSTHIPANQWTYIGISRNVSAMTITLYVGTGDEVTTFGTLPYSLPINTAAMVGDPSFQVGTPNVAYFSNPPGPGYFSPELVIIADTYMWNPQTTLSNHESAITGTPPTSGLIFNCSIQNTPVVSITALTGTLTGTINPLSRPAVSSKVPSTIHANISPASIKRTQAGPVLPRYGTEPH